MTIMNPNIAPPYITIAAADMPNGRRAKARTLTSGASVRSAWTTNASVNAAPAASQIHSCVLSLPAFDRP
jgi:hypothetical protein